MKNENLTMRSKIQVRWSTTPRDIGYPDYPGQPETNWRTSKPEIVSLKKAVSFNNDLSQRIGQGVFRVISYQHNGHEISLAEINDVLLRDWFNKLQRP